MIVHDDFFDCIYRRMCLRTRINIATIKINTVWVNSVVTSRYSIRVYYRKNVEYKFISKQSSFLVILSELLDDSSHDMRCWYLAWMHSGSNYYTFFVTYKLFRLVIQRK